MAKLIVGVMGPGEEATKVDLINAFELGKFCAKNGWITLTGGRNKGVMNEALRGARQNNGLTIGILSSSDKSTFSEFIDIPIVTNMRSGRNYINALSCDILVACGMGPGTSSEISLALCAKKKVILLGASAAANAFYKELDTDRVFLAKDHKDASVLLQKFLI